MSTALYDLALRLRAANTGKPAARMLHTPQPPTNTPIAALVERGARGGVTVRAMAEGQTATGQDLDGLAALARLGAHPARSAPPTLVVADDAALAALARLARDVAPGSEHAAVAAVIAWWDQRVDHDGASSVLLATRAAAARWALGTSPEQDRALATWRAWLGITESGPAALMALADAVTAGKLLPGLDGSVATEQRSWDYLRERVAQGWDWRRPDDREQAALGLATRTHAAELYESACLADPRLALRETVAGNLVAGHAVEISRNTLVIESEQGLCRLRTDSDVQGWRGDPTASAAGGPRVAGRLTQAAVTESGGLILTLQGPRASNAKLAVGDPITLRPAAVQASAQQSGRRALSFRYRTRANWLASGRVPAPRRRHVPLDVMVAAAENDETD